MSEKTRKFLLFGWYLSLFVLLMGLVLHNCRMKSECKQKRCEKGSPVLIDAKCVCVELAK
jgi:hypothetical protein